MDQHLKLSSKVTAMFGRKCMECKMEVVNSGPNLSWEAMEFCDSYCLSKYQQKIDKQCPNCHTTVESVEMFKRIGFELRQICGYECFSKRRGNLKMCSYCQMKISGEKWSFVKPKNYKRKCKDFCGLQCLKKYNNIINRNHRKTKNTCTVCGSNIIKLESHCLNDINWFCGDACFKKFPKNNFATGKCDMCQKRCTNKILAENSIFVNNAQHNFCSRICQSIYMITNKKMAACSLCKIKKFNFEMITFTFQHNNPFLMLCSLRCVNLFQKSVDCYKEIKCGNCHKILHHSAVSDNTIYSFCSYTCIRAFRSQPYESQAADILQNEQNVASGTLNNHLLLLRPDTASQLENLMKNFEKFEEQYNIPVQEMIASPDIVMEEEGTTNNSFPNPERDDVTHKLKKNVDELEIQINNAPASTSTVSSGTTQMDIMDEFLEIMKNVHDECEVDPGIPDASKIIEELQMPMELNELGMHCEESPISSGIVIGGTRDNVFNPGSGNNSDRFPYEMINEFDQHAATSEAAFELFNAYNDF